MKFILIACLVAVAVASPQSRRFSAPVQVSRTSDSDEVVAILRDDRVQPEDGQYSFDVETEDGIKRSESGDRLDDVENSPVGQQGSYSFTFPDGEEFELKYVANENGFQPESSWLPVAPEFPHPIPQFVLDQIEKAAREDAEEAAQAARKAPSSKGRVYFIDDSDERK